MKLEIINCILIEIYDINCETHLSVDSNGWLYVLHRPLTLDVLYLQTLLAEIQGSSIASTEAVFWLDLTHPEQINKHH